MLSHGSARQNYLKSPHQLLVLGSGMEAGGQKPNRLTRERGQATRTYFEAHGPQIARVVFSTAFSSQVNGNGEGRLSEASVMADIADLPVGITVLEERSRSTLGNLIESLPLLDPDLPTGILAHRHHLRRARLLARHVLPMPVFGVGAESFGAKPESIKKLPAELFLYGRELLYFHGVQPGDHEALARAATRVDQFNQRLKHFPWADRLINGQAQYH